MSKLRKFLCITGLLGTLVLTTGTHNNGRAFFDCRGDIDADIDVDDHDDDLDVDIDVDD